MVSDLLIQSRGYERNHLAVEMKRKGNNRHANEDRERLASMVSLVPIITVEITGLFYEFKTRLLTKVENLDDSIIDYEWEV